jgi:hypothetical protein
MSQPSKVIHVEIRATSGARLNDLTVNAQDSSLYDVLVLLSQKEWAQDLFTEKEDRVTPLPGYMMVLGSRMVQQWEVEDTPVIDGQNLKFVQVVPGG